MMRASATEGAIGEPVVASYDPTSSISGGMIVRSYAVGFAAALILAPPGARAADLVVWWEK
jgi:hypothetical protein